MPLEQLESLVSNPAMRDALATVFERSDGGTQELQWADVSDQLSSGQWGRLIERGILTEGTAGFVLAKPEAIEQRLDPDDGAGDTDTSLDPVPWSMYDKAAALLALGLFAGYSMPSIKRFVASIDNVVLAPVDAVLPFYLVILVLAVVTGLYSSVLQEKLMDTELVEQYREQMNDLQERRKRAKERDDDEALERIQEEQMESMGDQLGLFKLQFRPMVWIMLITIPVFLWMRWKINAGHIDPDELRLVLPLAGRVGLTETLFGPFRTWLAWYFLCSFASRQVIRKTLNFRTATSS